MRRIALIVGLLALGPVALLVASAGADDSHTYKIEMDNAFGLVHDSEVRIAGVTAGTVEDLDVNDAKRAVITVKVSGPLSQFRVDATCSSQPQSLIAEYFLDCQPGTSDKKLPDNGTVPVTQTRTTVQNDLVQATLREPFKERLALLINEFGTALAGNPDNLNAAIRRGAPALTALRKALKVVGDQNTVIRDLNANSDEIIGRLTERRQDVVRFIQNANATAVATADRKEDVERNFERLPGFLSELRPTLARLGDVSVQSTPVLNELNLASGQLNRLTRTLPRFNDASVPAVNTLGDASVIGRQALLKGQDEIQTLDEASKKAFPAANPLANFLVDLDDPNRAVETDARAARDTGRPAPTGYTGLEGLLNYTYYQPLAINQFDQVGHMLHFILKEFQVGPCGQYNAGPTVPSASDTAGPGQPGYVGTTSSANTNRCVSWLGPNQPGINAGPSLPPYSGAACPVASNAPSICQPSNPRQSNPAGNARQSPAAGGSPISGPQQSAPAAGGGGGGAGGGNATPNLPNLPNLPNAPKGPKTPNVPNVPGLPNVPNTGGGLGGLLGGDSGGQQSQGGGGDATGDLLNFLFGT